MAKQRPRAKPKSQPSVTPAQSPGRTRSERSARPEGRPKDNPGTAPPKEPAVPARSSAYFEAVALYEQGLAALQRRQYREAVDLLQSVLRQYPDEKELHERVRLYLNICERQATRQTDTPHTIEERLFAATLAMNGGKYDEAISHLRLVRDEDPDNDHALYMLAAAHAQRGEHAEAIAHLERAIALNPENRALARRDSDLDPLRDDEAFRSALETASQVARMNANDRRKPNRTKTGR